MVSTVSKYRLSAILWGCVVGAWFVAQAGAAVAAPRAGSTITIMLTDTVPLEMVRIPAGNFWMGSAFDPGYSGPDEAPVRQVTIESDFYIGKFTVTQEQWSVVMGSNPSDNRIDASNPVEEVSWNDCQTFITQLNARGIGTFRLPSEAEWEYACRAGSTTRWHFGDDPAPLGNYAWYTSNSSNKTHPVGQKLPNAFGLYDMMGNVFQWCEDDWHDNYTGAPATGTPWVDTPTRGINRVFRGGVWDGTAVQCRSAARGYDWSDGGHWGFMHCGLRLARIAPPRTTGDLQVTLAPPEAVAAGAQWRRVGTTPWLASGYTETDLTAGGCTVEFKTVAGWVAPSNDDVQIVAAQTAATVGTYAPAPPSGNLQVTLTPSGAVAAGAQWRRVGTTTWIGSGGTESAIPVGSYTVEFKTVPGWTTPANEAVTINENETAAATGIYVIKTYALTYLAGAHGTIDGATSRTQTVDYGGSGTAVTAVPATGFHFVRWSDGSTANPRTDTNVTVAMNVTATFDLITYTVTVNKAGTGAGTVTWSPNLASYAPGTTVTLTAVPYGGSVFAGWSGDATGATPSVTITMNANEIVTATFVVVDPTNYKVTYKGCSIAAGDLLRGGALVVDSWGDKSSVKIQKIQNLDPARMLDVEGKILFLKDCPTELPEVQVTGSGMGTFYTDAPVGLLGVAGRLGKLSTKDAMITNVVVAGRLGSVNMGSLTRGKETSVVSGGGPADSLTAAFSGVCVAGLRTQQTVKKLSVASKMSKAGVVDGVIGDNADPMLTLLAAPNFGTISATAGIHARIMAGWDSDTASPTCEGAVKAISTSKTGSMSGEVYLSPSAADSLKMKGTCTMVIKTAP